jgi:hypothetical protein
LGTISGEWVELWWTPKTRKQLDLFSAEVMPVAPATSVTDNGRNGVHFPVRSGAGALSLTELSQARGSGQADGGLVVRTGMWRFEVARLRASLENQLVSGEYTLNGVESGGQSLLRCDSSQGRLVADPVPAGEPLTIRVEDVPLYATPELLEALETALGTSPFGAKDVLAEARATFVYAPPQP